MVATTLTRLPHISVCDGDHPSLGESEPVTWNCCRVALMGLDGAGKTSLLCAERWGPGQVDCVQPSHETDVEVVRIKRRGHFLFFSHAAKEAFAVMDYSGQAEHRDVWKTFRHCGTIILFVVDSTRPDRLDEAASQLRQVLLERTAREKMEGRFLHFYLLANKQDLPNALPPAEVAARLHVTDLPCFERVFGVSSKWKHPLREVLRDIHAEKSRGSSPE
eukprot:m.211106 g.211106  ORF g.211106 m.211106 type:complete len:219 (-) comp17841_c0_seq1:699-1355(-)